MIDHLVDSLEKVFVELKIKREINIRDFSIKYKNSEIKTPSSVRSPD